MSPTYPSVPLLSAEFSPSNHEYKLWLGVGGSGVDGGYQGALKPRRPRGHGTRITEIEKELLGTRISPKKLESTKIMKK